MDMFGQRLVHIPTLRMPPAEGSTEGNGLSDAAAHGLAPSNGQVTGSLPPRQPNSQGIYSHHRPRVPGGIGPIDPAR